MNFRSQLSMLLSSNSYTLSASLRRQFFAGVMALLAISAGCKKEQPATTLPTPDTTPKRAAIPAKPVPGFDANRVMADINKQVAFGPRVPNSAAHQKAVDYFREVLGGITKDVQVQEFTAQGYGEGETLKLTNLLASFNPTASTRILIVTHYDSRPWADEDPDKANHTKPVPAANDGASGAAILLELARQFKDNPPPIGVDIFLNDGEDYGIDSRDSMDRYFLGVKYFMKNKPANYVPVFAILLDMVGDKNADFRPEGFSTELASPFVREIWNTASSLQLKHFNSQAGQSVYDDHLPMNQGGIPTVDIIDYGLVGHLGTDPDRKYWHTIDDLPKHLSTETLGEVGRLLLTLIYDRVPKDIPNL